MWVTPSWKLPLNSIVPYVTTYFFTSHLLYTSCCLPVHWASLPWVYGWSLPILSCPSLACQNSISITCSISSVWVLLFAGEHQHWIHCMCFLVFFIIYFLTATKMQKTSSLLSGSTIRHLLSHPLEVCGSLMVLCSMAKVLWHSKSRGRCIIKLALLSLIVQVPIDTISYIFWIQMRPSKWCMNNNWSAALSTMNTIQDLLLNCNEFIDVYLQAKDLTKLTMLPEYYLRLDFCAQVIQQAPCGQQTCCNNFWRHGFIHWFMWNHYLEERWPLDASHWSSFCLYSPSLPTPCANWPVGMESRHGIHIPNVSQEQDEKVAYILWLFEALPTYSSC